MIIISQKSGQLANQLILFAHFIAFGITNKVSIINVAFDEYAEFFETTKDDIFCCYPHRQQKIWIKKDRIRQILYRFSHKLASVLITNKINLKYLKAIQIDFREELLLDSHNFLDSFNPKQVILVRGFRFRDEKNFIKYANEIRTFFTPLEKHQHNISILIKNIRKKCDILIGVHIRHGDYKTYLGGKYFYEIAQYVEFMEQVEKIFFSRKVAFLICSNVQHEGESFSKFNFTFGNNQIIEDMYSLAQCDYIIGPPSTYSTWASFYGKVPLYRIKDANVAISLEKFKIYVPGMDYKYPEGLSLEE